MALELTYDYHLPAVQEPGFHRRYESREIVRSLNAVDDSVSNKLFWADQATHTLMLKPLQLEKGWLNGADQLNSIIRLAAFQANPTNITSQLVIEKAFLQNSNNPWIFHGPISPVSGVSFVDSPEQLPGITQLENVSGQAGSVTSFPTNRFPGTAATDLKVICWTKAALPWNMPLYLRWWIGPESAGHQSIYDFHIGQFCLRVGASAVEVFRDTSVAHDRSSWVKTFGANLFAPGPIDTVGYYGNGYPGVVSEQNGETRALLWLPYRRNYVYMEGSKGKWGVFQANDTPRGNGVSGVQADWAIVEPRNLVVAGLTPGPGWFQIQKLTFPSETGVFNLPPFTTDYAPAGTPNQNWLRDAKDTPEGSTISHSTPTASIVYSFRTNTIDAECPTVTTTTDASNQSRTFQSQYSFTAGTDPASALKTYTPMLYGIDTVIGGTTVTWPVTATTISDVSLAPPSARIKKASFTVDVTHPGRFDAEIEDLSESLAALYNRFYMPVQFADDLGDPAHPLLWQTLWLGIADPIEVRELRLDVAAPREIRTAGTDFFKWLNDSPIRDTRDWTGVGHITVIQQILQLAGVSVANWDGPSPGTYNSGTGAFTIDPLGWDTPLGGLNLSDPTLNTGDSFTNQNEPLHPTWRPNLTPPDSYGSFVRRIADLFSGWDFFFNANGSVGYMPYNYYTASEAVFHSSSVANPAGPLYYRPSVEFRTVEPDANVVQAVTGNHAGSRQYSSLWVDFNSIYVQTAVNYVGKPKFLLFALPGWTPCTDLNRCARAVFTRARRRHSMVTFHGTYLPGLKLNHCFQLQGQAGTYRLVSVKAEYSRPGWDTAMYSAELVENGYS